MGIFIIILSLIMSFLVGAAVGAALMLAFGLNYRGIVISLYGGRSDE